MAPRELLGARVKPETKQLLRKMAKKHYGDEKKIGYIVDSAVEAFFLNEMQPIEASRILSVTEERLISQITGTVNQMVHRTVERVASITAKDTYEINLISLMLEEVFRAAAGEGWKDRYNLLRKEAAQRMKGKLSNEGAEITAQLADENERLRVKVEELTEKVREAQEYFRDRQKREQALEQQHRTLSDQLKQLKKERETLLNWVRELIEQLENAGPLARPATILKDHIKAHGRPRGV